MQNKLQIVIPYLCAGLDKVNIFRIVFECHFAEFLSLQSELIKTLNHILANHSHCYVT